MGPIWRYILPLLVLLYILSPYDILPDMLGLPGRLDDLLLLGWLLFSVFRGKRAGIPGGRPNRSSNRARESEESPNRGASGRTQAGAEEKERSSPPDPYEVLGIAPDAAPEEVRAAYRRESQRYHPDKVAHLGEEFQQLAHEKFKEIQRAYEILRARGGW
jgi:hypothetical protein